MKTRRLTVALALLALGASLPLRAADGPYRKLKEIPIGGEGGWDYLSVDAAARRLYVSHATKVLVVDIDEDVVVGEIAPAPGVHGIALAPDLGRGFVSNGREATVSIVDLKTLQIVGTVKTGENPDAILYEPGRREVYAFNGREQVRHRLRREDGRGSGDDPAARQARVRGLRREGGAHLRQHRGHEPARRDRHRDPRGRGDVAHHAGRGGVGTGLRPGGPSALRRVQQRTDADGRRRERQGPRERADRRGRGRERLRPGHGPRVRVERRRHPDRGPPGGEGRADRGADPRHAEALADDDDRPEDAPALRRGGGVRAADNGPGRQAAAPTGRPRLVQGRRLRDEAT